MNPELTQLTIPHLLEASFKKFSDKLAFKGLESYSYTYSELKDKINSISSFIRSKGIVKGDRVAILAENHPHWGITFFAITQLGIIAVPVMPEFNPVEVHHILHHSEAKAIFVSSKLYPKIEDENFEHLKIRVLLDDFSIIPNEQTGILKRTIEKGKEEYARIKEAAYRLRGNYEEGIKEDDIASIVYTSGTTGYSKGVMLSHKNIVSNAIATLGIVNVTENDRLLSILPLAHTMECTLGLLIPVMVGGTVYYLEKPPAAASLLPALELVKPTVMLSVPLIIEKIYRMKILPEFQKKAILRNLYKIPMLRKKLNHIAGKKLLKTFGGQLKMFCIGGAPLAEDVEMFLQEAKFPYAVGYGLTETSPLVTGTPPESVHLQSAGKVLPGGIEIQIDNPDAITGAGEILVKGPNVMKGYFKNPEATEAVFTSDGWFKTGDLGAISEDGYIFIKGRIKNMILGPNGKNIYPEELESLINEQPYVVESIVFQNENQLAAKVHLDYKGLDDEFFKKNLLESEIREEIRKLLEGIRNKINNRVATYAKISKFFEQTVPFEKTPTLKIKRFLYT